MVKMNRKQAIQIAVGGLLIVSGAAMLLSHYQQDNKEMLIIEPKVEEVELVETKEPIEPKEAYYVLSDEERTVVEHIVAGEARGESLKGQMLVAQCILNGAIKDDIPPSKVRTKYKYGGWSNEVTDSVKEAVERVFDNGELVVDEPILYFYAPKLCVSKWHESQCFVIKEGCHKFFKEWS